MNDKEKMLQEVIAAVRKPVRAGSGHSPLYLWLWENHDHLAAEMTPPHQPNWSEMADALGRLGILDGGGKTPTAKTTRNTWWKVNRDRDAVAAGTKRQRGRPKKAAAPPQPAKGPTPAAPMPPRQAPKRRSAPVPQADDDVANFVTPLKRPWET